MFYSLLRASLSYGTVYLIFFLLTSTISALHMPANNASIPHSAARLSSPVPGALPLVFDVSLPALESPPPVREVPLSALVASSSVFGVSVPPPLGVYSHLGQMASPAPALSCRPLPLGLQRWFPLFQSVR